MFNKTHRHLIPVLLGMLAVLQQSHAAEGPPVALSIQAQPLSEALRQFAHQSGLQLVFKAEDIDPRLQAPAIVGTYKPEIALKQMLENSGLKYKFVNPSTVAVQPAVTDVSQSRSDTVEMLRVARNDETAAKQEAPQESSKSRTGADDNAKGTPEILVRGSKVLNTDIQRTRDDVLPYVVFDREKIERSGAANLEDFLKQRLPQNTQMFAYNQLTATTGNRSQINLRGLGANQTLILIDGRRVMGNIEPGSGTPDQPDINGIPLAAIERIEVLPASASGIYGGSATGGVINIVMKRNFSTSEIRLGYDNSFDTDTGRKRVDLSTGFTLEEGRTNVLLSGSYSVTNEFVTGDRDFESERRARRYFNNAAGFLPPNAPPLGATANISSATTVGGVLQPLTLKNGTALGSTYTSAPVNYVGAAVDGGAALVANAGRYNFDLADSAQYSGGANQSLMNAPTVKSISATIRREFTPHIQAFIDVAASDNVGRYRIGGLVSSVMTLAASAPSNPFQQAIQVAVPTATADGELLVESYDRRLTGGIIFGLPRQWHGEADYSISRPKYGFTTPIGYGTGLTPTGTTLVQNGTLDILRGPNAAAVNFAPYLYPGYYVTNVAHLKNASLRFAGPTFSLPAGPVKLSFLAERRDETYDEYLLYIGPNLTFAPKKTQTVDSAYVEARIPLVSSRNALPLVKSLELQVAGRHDRYDLTAGGTISLTATPNASVIWGRSSLQSTNPTVGLQWQPAEDLMLRTSYGTGFLPPTVAQIVKTPATNPTPLTVVDPRRGNTSYVVPVWYGGGNPDLKPEQSENWSAGAVLTPRFAPSLRISVDYTRVDFTDRIASLAQQFVVDNESLFPERLTRGANLSGDLPGWAGPITVLDASLANLAKAQIEAYDVQLDYSITTAGAGTFDLFALGTWQTHYKTQATPSAQYLENVGYSSRPAKFRANSGVTWRHADWTVGWNTRYVSGFRRYAPTSSAGVIAVAILNQGNNGWVNDQIYHDVFATYRFGESAWARGMFTGSEIQVGVNNVLNTEPPYDSEVPGYSTFGDARLANYYLNFRKSF